MELYRSFTTRRLKQHDTPVSPDRVGRAASQRAGRPIPRAQISAPVALLSTSNIGLNNARHIAGTDLVDIPKTSSDHSTSSASDDDSDTSSGSVRTRDTATDASSIENLPYTPGTEHELEPNHLSCYFKPAVDTTSKTSRRSPSVSTTSTMDAPKIPQRVPSHSKRAHESLHRKRSVQRIISPQASSRELSRTSVEMFGPQTSSTEELTKEGPFGNELAQLDEVVEEFGHAVHDVEAIEDVAALRAFNLAQYAATDYMIEIQSLVVDTFGAVTATPCWI